MCDRKRRAALQRAGMTSKDDVIVGQGSPGSAQLHRHFLAVAFVRDAVSLSVRPHSRRNDRATSQF